MASLTQWTWVWVNSQSWWWTGKPGVLQSIALQRVGHDWAELNWLITAIKSQRQHILYWFDSPPLFSQGNMKRARWHLHTHRVASWEWNFELREPKYFISSKHACSLLQRQTFSLLYMERAMPAFATEEDTFFTFKHPWKDSLEPREAKGLLVKRAETWLMHENRLPAINICYSYQKKVFFFKVRNRLESNRYESLVSIYLEFLCNIFTEV